MDFKQQLRIAYDKDAKRRDYKEGKRNQWKLDVRQHFCDLLKKEGKRTVLELGSGVGLDAKYFQDNGFEVLATDLSNEMVKMCRKRGLDAKVVDLYNLSSLGKKYDGVYSMNVLLHIPMKDLCKVLKIIALSLNEGGIFFYGVYSNGSDEETTFTDKSRMNLPRLFSFLSDKTLLDVVKERFKIINFRKVEINDNNPNFYFQSLFLRKK